MRAPDIGASVGITKEVLVPKVGKGAANIDVTALLWESHLCICALHSACVLCSRTACSGCARDDHLNPFDPAVPKQISINLFQMGFMKKLTGMATLSLPFFRRAPQCVHYLCLGLQNIGYGELFLWFRQKTCPTTGEVQYGRTPKDSSEEGKDCGIFELLK